MFVFDFADDFFDQILNRDQALGARILIQYDGQMCAGAAHFVEQRRHACRMTLDRTQDIEADHVAGAFPDAVERRLAVEAGQLGPEPGFADHDHVPLLTVAPVGGEPGVVALGVIAIAVAAVIVASNVNGLYPNNMDTIFISGFITNAIVAVLLTFIGDRLGLDLYLVALINFGFRIFNNVALIRRHFI